MSLILWAGTDGGFEEYQAALLSFGAMSPKDFPAPAAVLGEVEGKRNLPRLLSIYGSTAVISIHGVLTDKNNWFNQYAGLVSYSDIREAVVTALADEGVKEILGYVKSPGGVVAGLNDTYEFIKKASKIKPMTLYSDSIVASAAMWISAPMQHKLISADATAGSIGVVARHIEYSKQMESDGVTATVLRAGEFKQLANSVEPLSDKARGELQAHLDHTYGVFVQAMADSYNTSYQEFDSRMAQGREFIGSQAVDVGLMDAVSNFDAVLEKIQKRATRKSNSGGFGMKKTYALTAENMAALSAGAKIEDLGLEEIEVPTTKAEAEAALEAAATDEERAAAQEVLDGILAADKEAADKKALADAEAALEAAATDEEKAEAQAALDALKAGPPDASADDTQEPESSDSSVVDLLKSQLAAKEEELFQAKVDLKASNEKVALFDEVGEKFKEIAARAVNNMTVALGGSEIDGLADLDYKALLRSYDTAFASFTKSFKPGVVSSADSGKDVKKTTPKVSRLHQATLSAVKTGRQ